MVEETSDGAVRVTGNRGRSPGLQVGVKVRVSVPTLYMYMHKYIQCTLQYMMSKLHAHQSRICLGVYGSQFFGEREGERERERGRGREHLSPTSVQ